MSNEQEMNFEDEDSGVREMVNISDEPIVVRISRGTRVQKVVVKPGESREFEAAYCDDVRGAGRQRLLPILTRQTMREDRIPRLVRAEQAEEARSYYESRVYGTHDENQGEIDALEAALAAAKARKAVLDKRSTSPATSAPVKAPKAKSKAKAKAKKADAATANLEEHAE